MSFRQYIQSTEMGKYQTSGLEERAAARKVLAAMFEGNSVALNAKAPDVLAYIEQTPRPVYVGAKGRPLPARRNG